MHFTAFVEVDFSRIVVLTGHKQFYYAFSESLIGFINTADWANSITGQNLSVCVFVYVCQPGRQTGHKQFYYAFSESLIGFINTADWANSITGQNLFVCVFVYVCQPGRQKL